MKYINNKSASLMLAGIALLVGFILFISWTSPSVNNNSTDEKIKSRFPSMLLNIDTANKLKALPGYHHFVFQVTGSDKSGFFGKRRVYTLVVFAADANGNLIDKEPLTSGIDTTSLIEIQTIDKEVSDRNTEVLLSVYFMSNRQYEALVTSGTTAIRFDPSLRAADNRLIFDGYITYEISPVSAGTIAADARTAQVLSDDDFLKPSPPAPPDL